MAMDIVDTHVHVWDLEKAEYAWLQNDTSILNRTYSIEMLSPRIRKAHVTEGILVQAANNFEDTDLMLGVAGRTAWIKGVVGWVPLQDPGSTETILTGTYSKNHYLKGCRHLIHNEPDPRWLLQENVIESLKILAGQNLSFDVVGISTDHLRTAVKVAEKLPGLRMVLDHLNQPPIASKEKFGLWGDLIKEAAQCDNVCAKISGLGTCAASGDKWTSDDLKPYVMFALEAFGADRCFCGGDWPVALLAGPYEKAWLAYQQILEEELPLNEQEKVLSENARRFYSLLD